MPNGIPPHSQCLPNGIPPTTGPMCGPMSGNVPIIHPQHTMGPGLPPHHGPINGHGAPGGLPNGATGPPHLPIPTPPIHTSNPSSLMGGGPNGPQPLHSGMIGGPGNSNNGVGLPPLPPMSTGIVKPPNIRLDS